MASNLDSRIKEIVNVAAGEIAAAVRQEIAAEIQALVVGQSGGRAPARRAAAPAPTRAAGSGGRGGRKAAARPAGRRTSEQVAADDKHLLDWIKAHPGLRSEDIQRGTGMSKPNVASGLLRLRDAGTIKMKGIKRAATYTA